MASLTPRVSRLWSDTTRTSYFRTHPADSSIAAVSAEEEDELDELDEMGRLDERAGDVDVEAALGDGRTALDRTIDRIGMGRYQWMLLALSGFGWMADNMWMEAVAIALPRVQQHYAISNSLIGTLSSSMFAGMMFGAVGWGTFSDLMGRTTAFNTTLLLTALFGILAGFTQTFAQLCVALFLLGSAVGGSMPTDGTLFLENLPKGKQYLLTALSVFFSLGAVATAAIALLLVPSNSCTYTEPCDVDVSNRGWKYLLITLGVITLCMFLARIVFFRLHESPRYLVSAGRPQAALESLQMISRFNGDELSLDLKDVDDSLASSAPPDSERAPFLTPSLSRQDAADADDIGAQPPTSARRSSPSHIVFDAGADIDADEDGRPSMQESRPGFLAAQQRSTNALRTSEDIRHYAATTDGVNAALAGYTFETPRIGTDPGSPGVMWGAVASKSQRAPLPSEFRQTASPVGTPRAERVTQSESTTSPVRPRLSPRPRLTSRARPSRMSVRSRRASFYEVEKRVNWVLPVRVRRGFAAWLDKVALVLSPEWRFTTIMVWAVWGMMSLAFTMFNVYLPKLLETRSGASDTGTKTLAETLWDVLIFTIGGCPGAIVGAWMVETQLGRRGSLASSTAATALCCVVFLWVQTPFGVRASTMAISLCVTVMWAVLYGWTPELFDTEVRGTACGIASALSRIGGMIAPMLGGVLLAVDPSWPVYASIATLAAATLCVLLLDPPGSSDGGKGGGALMH